MTQEEEESSTNIICNACSHSWYCKSSYVVVSCPSCKAQIRRYDKQQTDIRQITASDRQLSRLLEYVKGVDFVTFNTRIGVPRKRKDMSGQLWDYQLDIANKLVDSKYLWILKAVGLGITECCLRWILYKAMTSDDWSGKQVPIIVGPNINLATKLIKRIRRIFEQHSIFFDTKETFVVINGVEIECFPSHHLDAVRSLESPACIYISEADFFPVGQQSVVRQVSERYITKSNPWIIMESTANAPGGLFDTMSNEQDSIYTKLYLDYTYGLDKMYTAKEVEAYRRSPSFAREMELKFLGLIGNTFRTADIERAQSFVYDPDFINPDSSRTIAIDPAYGSSNFAIIVLDDMNGKVVVLRAEEFENTTSQEMIPYIEELMSTYAPIDHVYIDGSSIDLIKNLKGSYGEEIDYHAAIDRYKHPKSPINKVDYTQVMTILPINFKTDHVKMLSHCRYILEQGYLAIDKQFSTLIMGLHNCSDIEGSVDKSFAGNDLFDALRMGLMDYYQ